MVSVRVLVAGVTRKPGADTEIVAVVAAAVPGLHAIPPAATVLAEVDSRGTSCTVFVNPVEPVVTRSEAFAPLGVSTALTTSGVGVAAFHRTPC